MTKLLVSLMFTAALALGVIAPAHSTSISTTIQLGTVYTGATPDGTPPWLTATFTSSTGSNTGTLTLTSGLTAPDFLQGLENNNPTVGWAFYLDQSLSSLTCTTGTCASNALFGGSYNTGPVKGGFNLAFGWSSKKPKIRFVAGSSATYTLTFDSPLTGNPFVANGDGWISVAHVQGITTGTGSGWIVNGVPVPEPAALGMFGAGLLTIGLLLGLRRRRA